MGSSSQAKEFRDHIWEYNRTLAFTSLGVEEDYSVNDGRGPPMFRILGKLCHHIGSLLPPPDCTPSYAQLYIYDPHEALHHYMDNPLREDTMELLQSALHENNCYARLFLHAWEILHDEPVDVDDMSVRLRVQSGTDQRQYNLPMVDEVAVIVPNEGTNSES